jgi:hypothetical protein
VIAYLEVCGAVIGTVGMVEGLALLTADVLSLFGPRSRRRW